MVIYGEYLFVENFITGLLVIILTLKLAGEKFRVWRILSGSILCASAAFTIFLDLSGVVAVLLRILIAVSITAVAMGAKRLIKKTVLFLILSFLSGGIAMAFLTWLRIPSVSANGSLYVEALTYAKIICWGTVAFSLTYWFVKFVRDSRLKNSVRGEVNLIIKGRSYRLKAFVDTGNSLREPLSGKPVILIDAKGKKLLCEEQGLNLETVKDRHMIIPYRSIGTEKGLLEGLRCDEAQFKGKRMKGVAIGFYNGEFEDFEVLMNMDVLEGGLVEDGENL